MVSNFPGISLTVFFPGTYLYIHYAPTQQRRERARYDEIYTKLENDVQHYSRNMTKVLEKGQESIKAREKAVSEYEALVVQLEQEKAALAAEQEELSTLEEHFRLRRATKSK